MKANVAAATDIGLVRDHNEDAYLVEDPLYVVADGMGGHLGGEVASATALETVGAVVADEGIEALADSVRRANKAVYDRQVGDAEVAGMGTTLTAVALQGSQLHVAHVGDSRAYLLRGGTLEMLTQDHSLVGEMMREGSLTEAQARVHPRRSTLTRALGIAGEVTVDTPEVPVQGGDRILLCSDGLSGMVEDPRLQEILRNEPDPERACAALIAEANANGGVDNITTVIVDLISEEGDNPAPVETGPAETEPSEPGLPSEERGWLRRLLKKK
jgi:protein phosphatase